MIASLNLFVYPKKPFNPILGETHHSHIEGTDIYLEQTSHHPPIYHFYILGKDFKFYGWREMSLIGTGNTIEANIIGDTTLERVDGTVYKYKYGKFRVSGIIMGKRLYSFEGWFSIEDITNNLICCFEVNPKPKTGGMLSRFFGKKKQEHFPDYFEGFIANSNDVTWDEKTMSYSVDPNAVLHTLDGEASSHLNFDGKCFWKLGNTKLAREFKHDFRLESDSYYRDDILLFRHGKTDLAQYAKMVLEDNQRKDRKLREKHSKDSHK